MFNIKEWVLVENIESDSCGCRCIHEDRIIQAKGKQLPEPEVDRLARLFKAMGDPNRLRILWALTEDEMCVCDLASFIGASESAVSHQLRQLRQLYLVSNRRAGAVLYYRLNDDHVSRLMLLALEHVRE